MTTGIPEGLEAIYSSQPILRVELSKCRDWQSFSYTGDGWHYQAALIRQYVNDPSLKCSDSILKKYYERYQPKCLQDILFKKSALKIPPVHRPGPALPWLASPPRFGRVYQHYGPLPNDFIQKEFERTIGLYIGLKKAAYQPEKYKDGYIRGYFLTNKNDYRFIVTNGHHRLAALAILNYRTVEVKIDPKCSRVYNVQRVHEMINVRNGVYTKRLARKIMLLPFVKNGKEKAEALGLYEQIYDR